MKRLFSLILALSLLPACLSGCQQDNADPTVNTTGSTEPAVQATTEAATQPVSTDETSIVLSDERVTVNGQEAGQSGAVYLSHDVIYYEDKQAYDSGNLYGEGSAGERHSAQEAAGTLVVNITRPGTYRLSGTLSQGQIRVDLGESAKEDPEAVVTVLLDHADITCPVAPAILFMNVYECDNAWSVDTAAPQVDTSAAGANLVLEQGSVNRITGSHVAKIFKDTAEEKKLWKQDGAIYSYMSMNIASSGDGSGTLELTADNEGIGTELHLSINSGNINIRSQDDGINTNEDGVSVTAINGGNVHIIAGLGIEGDGIDSNGYLVINGGTVVASANPGADAGLDSDLGSFVNGGTVIALGSTMDWAESDSDQVTMNLQFAQYQASDSAIVVTKQDGSPVFAYDPSDDEVLGENVRRYMGAIISCPNFVTGEGFHVYIGGQITGSEVGGVYDPATITDYADGVQQSYTGTDVRGMGGMMPGGMMPGGGGHTPPEKPEGEPPAGFEGQQPPEPPEGGMDRPEPPEGGMEPPEGFEGQQPPEGFAPGGQASGEASTLFFMQDKVNCFSGVAPAVQ